MTSMILKQNESVGYGEAFGARTSTVANDLAQQQPNSRKQPCDHHISNEAS